ncbi:hypothetical protein [Emticicia agri]|uniref:Uncharacterized protein n=1 Tax=Emticicia agri TaxID=2492393 RepID=A0A4Q5LVT8_9BACT|nr:hypothetical protein [Emticicia agri]RYU93802.1 hypothetical protein EWM59_19975 [Emticicia agri]
MKKTFLFLLLVCALGACKSVNSLLFDAYTGNTYHFTYELVKPTPNTALLFNDDKIEATFDIKLNGLNFVVKNKTNETMKVIWDEASMVLGGKAEKVTHSGIRYMEKAASQPATTVPAGASLDDMVIPTSNIYYQEGFYSSYVSVAGDWKTRALFPNRDYDKPKLKEEILALRGTTFSLYLPILHQGKTLEYLFEFRITDVKPQGNKTESKKIGGSGK